MTTGGVSMPLVLTFVSTVAFAIQFLIFAYLYSSHRVRFFQYLLLAWAGYTVSKGLRLVDVLALDLDRPSFGTEVAIVAAVGFTLAAALAHRWDYRLRARDVLVGLGVAMLLSLVPGAEPNDPRPPAVGAGLRSVQMA